MNIFTCTCHNTVAVIQLFSVYVFYILLLYYQYKFLMTIDVYLKICQYIIYNI